MMKMQNTFTKLIFFAHWEGKRGWKVLPENIVKNCRIQKVSPACDAVGSALCPNNSLGPVWETLQHQIDTLVPVAARIEIENFINGPYKQDFVQIFETKEILFQDQQQDNIPSFRTEPDLEDPGTSLSSLREQLRTLSLAKRVLKGNVASDYTFLTAIASVQACVRLELDGNDSQSTINEFCNWFTHV